MGVAQVPIEACSHSLHLDLEKLTELIILHGNGDCSSHFTDIVPCREKFIKLFLTPSSKTVFQHSIIITLSTMIVSPNKSFLFSFSFRRKTTNCC